MRDTNHEQNSPTTLIALCDEFRELEAQCTFFCDAVASIVSSEETWLSESSKDGLCYVADWMKKRMAIFANDLEAYHQANRQQHESDPGPSNPK